MSYYTGDYSKQPLPYGAGSTRGMTQRHYEAIADTLRKALAEAANDHQGDSLATDIAVGAVENVIDLLATRFAAGNDRFRAQTFKNAALDVAREGNGS